MDSLDDESGGDGHDSEGEYEDAHGLPVRTHIASPQLPVLMSWVHVGAEQQLAHKTLVRSAASPNVSAGQVIRTTNGQTVVFTSMAGGHGLKQGTTQAIAVPQAGGGVSIVQLQIPANQTNVVQSVIQPNQQSVIQATGGAQTVQTVQLPKGNVILLKGQGGQGSVIHSADTDGGVHHGLQIISKSDDGEETITPVIFEDESRKRREILARRPSYRKILNDLSSTEAAGAVTAIPAEIKHEEDREGGGDGTATIQVGGQYLKVLPASAIQLGSQDGTLQGIQTLTMTNAGAGATGAIVQYATQGQDGQFYVPVTVSAADLQAYQIRTPSQTGITQGVVMTSTGGLQGGQVVVEEASKKRELRLLKNREAAKECRRKKKEYIKCLENRVAVLENQNKALIEELKSLKELYCQKAD
ncbi:unnamed protein product [Oppiella nova]|uniref:Uncharacterized protein n=1 Tax=Oppiella nova TaxID=334625 RepID=A0A7R9LS76_9ACAR|nr:unnamed protein product [Oppiella nova]CAG2166100.1 unnamed protein product [Oppiella nova]